MHVCDPTDYYLSQIKDLARVKYFTKFDFVCLSETWLKDEISFITVSATSWKEAANTECDSFLARQLLDSKETRMLVSSISIYHTCEALKVELQWQTLEFEVHSSIRIWVM